MNSRAARDQLWFEYASTTVFVAAALALQYVVDGPTRTQTGFEFTSLAILASAWLCRLGPSLWACAFATVGEVVLYLDPRYAFDAAPPGDVIELVMFATLAILICLLVDRLKRARRARDVTLRELTLSNFARDRSEHRLDAGLNAIADPILLLSPVRGEDGAVSDFVIEYQNEAAAALHAGGRDARADQVGRLLGDVGPIHARVGLHAGYVGVLEHGEPLDREMLIRHDGAHVVPVTPEATDDGTRHVEVRAHRLGDGVIVQWRDVSAHRRAEASYHQSEGRYRTLVRSSGAIVWTADADGRAAGPQPDWCRFTGQTAEEAAGFGVLEAIHPDDRGKTEQAWRAAVAGRQPYVVEHRVRRADGAYRHMSVRAVPILGDDGGVQEWLGVHTDVTERKLAESIIADSERQLRRVLDALFSYVVVTTPDGTVTGVNEAPLRASHTTADDVLGRKLWETPWWGDDATRARIREFVERAATGQIMRADLPIALADGTFTIVDLMISPMRDEQGTITHLIPSAVDVSDRYRAQADLAAREQRFRRLYESNLIGITFYDAAGDFEQPNSALREILLDGESDPDAGLGERAADATADRPFGWTRDTPPEWAEVDRLQRERLMRSGRCGPYEKEFARPDGTRVPVLVAAAELDPGHPGGGGVAFVLDLTHVKRVEETLRRAEANLRAANESLEQRIRERTAELQLRSDQLRALALDLTDTESRERKRLAQVLHDSFQQLVSAAKLKVGLVRRRMGEDVDPALLETIRQVEGLLAETIDASRALATELSPPVLHDAGLGPALDWLSRRMEKDGNLIVDVRFDDGCEPASEQVRTIIFECARELLNNVVKHSGADRASLAVSMPQPGLLQLSVTDPGRGFDPFLVEVKPKPDGTFGLFSMKERLALLGGLVRVRSHAGSGTTVSLTVPVTFRETNVASGPIAPHDSVSGLAVDNVPNVRVLVADDHKLFREGLISLIGQEPFVDIVGQANDGQEAVDLARTLRPDILICDVTMPKLNGVQVTTQLHREMPALKIIGLSMHERDDMATAMRDAGAVAYCTKGGPTETLLGVLRGVAGSGGVDRVKSQDAPADVGA